ncbi:MAG: hypothetical protein ACLUEK_03830 [Oscillospiraceae bacterium]
MKRGKKLLILAAVLVVVAGGAFAALEFIPDEEAEVTESEVIYPRRRDAHQPHLDLRRRDRELRLQRRGLDLCRRRGLPARPHAAEHHALHA